MMKPPRGLEEVISLLLSPRLARVSLLRANLLTKVTRFLIAREKPSAGQFKVPGSPFRVGGEISCSPERSLAFGKRGVPLTLQRRQEVSGALPCDCQCLEGIASEKHLWGFWRLPLLRLHKPSWGSCSGRWEVWKHRWVLWWDGCAFAGKPGRVRHGGLHL